MSQTATATRSRDSLRVTPLNYGLPVVSIFRASTVWNKRALVSKVCTMQNARAKRFQVNVQRASCPLYIHLTGGASFISAPLPLLTPAPPTRTA